MIIKMANVDPKRLAGCVLQNPDGLRVRCSGVRLDLQDLTASLEVFDINVWGEAEGGTWSVPLASLSGWTIDL